ncbi:MAG: radical SAM family heme chaperone HemW [Elusimicrobia bacterium]|nr:radical SAM family heme chaperone HemW [Elusimicrobiota bacterium]
MARGLYVHIPFCSVKCHFCDFAAYAHQEASVPRYLRALRRELEGAASLEFQTLYIGGGTPTLLSLEHLGFLLGFLFQRLDSLPQLLESSCEANPESATSERLALLREKGLNRLSLGLQARQDHLLRLLGRQHDWRDFLRAYTSAREVGWENINVDLMFALPRQTLADWKCTLESVLELEPEHLSLYSLQVEDRTLFQKRGITADEDLGARMYTWAVKVLKSSGYRHYEISNFARPGMECRHNLLYWSDEEYLGIGCSSSSYLGGKRRTNLRKIPEYCAAIEAGEAPGLPDPELSGRKKLGETALLGLRRMEGIAWSPELEHHFGEPLRLFLERGLLRRKGGNLLLTERGVLLGNRIFEVFV